MKKKNCKNTSCKAKNSVDEIGWCDNCGGEGLDENLEDDEE